MKWYDWFEENQQIRNYDSTNRQQIQVTLWRS